MNIFHNNVTYIFCCTQIRGRKKFPNRLVYKIKRRERYIKYSHLKYQPYSLSLDSRLLKVKLSLTYKVCSEKIKIFKYLHYKY